ncbi:MAG: glycosyltransferase [Deltaproteobacteria bacterium]|nr:glycosyltransferase [Deltaproteobacteria bacterium]
MKQVLFLTYLFPPAAGAGVHRPLSFVRHLPSFGWQPQVLTAWRPSAIAFDQALNRLIPSEALVTRLLNIEPRLTQMASSRISGKKLRHLLAKLMVPDRHVLWLATALPQLMAVAARTKARIIMASAPPYTTFMMGYVLAQLTGLPLLLDFRDVWSGLYASGYDPAQVNFFRKRVVLDLEGIIVKRAGAVTTASFLHGKDLARLHGDPGHKYYWLPNGFEESDFADAPAPKPVADQKITLLYTGTVFEMTTLSHLWAAMALLTEQERARFRVKLIGKAASGEVLDPELSGLEVQVQGYQPHAQVVREMRQAQVLLLTLEPMPNSQQVIPSKLYEYLAARSHILALVPPGEAAMIVEQNQAGTVVLPQNHKGIAQVLRRWIDRPPAPSPGSMRRFSRRAQSAYLAEILERHAA